MSTTLLPWPTGVRILPARLRRKASSEPAGREPVEQGAIPWRRLARRRRAGWAGAALMKRTRVVRFHGRRLHLAVGKRGHPAGFGNRRPLVRLQPARSVSARAERAKRGRGAAVPASLMSSRSWVRIPPAPLRADAEHRRAQRAVTPWPTAVVVRLHPSASDRPRGRAHPGRAAAGFRDSRGSEFASADFEPADRQGDAPWGRLSLASSRARVRLPPSPSNASVVSTASTRPLYGRGAGSNPAGGSSDVIAHLAGRRASVISPPGSTGGWRASARTAGLRPSLTPRPRS